ncbi:S24 family peptidase [Zavarzinia sp.]|uniref:S24 family peptidase n=1 Tax=Zavarzinia sp. TaxID=2027920 RepID=UPI003BB4D807
MTDKSDPTINYVRTILARTGLTATELARKAGLSPSTLNKKLSGAEAASLSLRTLMKLSEVSGIPVPASILVSEQMEREARHILQMPPNIDMAARNHLPPTQDMSKDIPVMGSVIGGVGGDFSMNGDIVDRVRRPPALANASDAFAVFVTGDSMEPRYEAGDLVFLHPHRPVGPGDDVVVECFGDHDGEGGPCYLKRLVRRSADKVQLRQFNPPDDEIVIPYTRIRRIYRVLRPNELYGF